MMDWTGEVCASFTYQPGVADIFVVDREGKVVHRISDAATEEKLQACYAVIDALLKPDNEASADEPQKESARPTSESTSDEPQPES